MSDALLDIEAVKQLKARYCRLLDTKDWDGFRALFTDDAMVDTTGSGGPRFISADEFIQYVTASLGGAVTVHHVHAPEITLEGEQTASGIWAMEDRVKFADGRELLGFGHYTETYAKVDGQWRISGSTLTRLRVDFA